MDYIVEHQVTYDYDGRASVPEVAKSLIAQDKLFREAVQVLEECFPDLDIEQLQINVREVTQDSPMRHRIEGIIIAAFSPELTKDMPADVLDTLFGIDVADGYDSIVSIIILLIGLWGAERVVNRIRQARKGKEKEKAEEEARKLATERRRLTKQASEQAAVPEEQMIEAVTKIVTKRSASITKAAMDFLSPAKRHKASGVRLPNGTAIPQTAIEAVPSDVDIADYEPPTEVTSVENALVTFYMHDRERSKHWAAVIKEVSPDRKPLHLAPDIDADALFTRETIYADVLVTSVRDADGDYIPSLYFLEEVHDDNAA